MSRAPVGVSILDGATFRSASVLRQLGVRAVRAEIHWSLVEAAPGRTDWTQIDALFADTDALNLEVLAVLAAPPDHIWKQPDTAFAASAARFARGVATRYALRAVHPLRAVEVFNEPNLAGYGWARRGEDPRKLAARYALTLRAVGAALREVEPKILIVSGGLSPDGMPPLEFLDVLAAGDTWQCFDAFGGHPYGGAHRLPQITRDLGQAFAVRGLSAKPIWFTELGDTNIDSCPRSLEAAWHGRAANQALFWFTLRDFGFLQPRYGLYTRNWQQRACGAMFARLAREP